MLQPVHRTHTRRSLSLSLKVALLLVIVAITPLLFSIGIITLVTRPTAIAQANREIETDAKIHTELIDNFFAERILAAEALSRLAPLHTFMEELQKNGSASETTKQRALDSLETGHGRGSYYENWTLLDLQGMPKLSYPASPLPHGQYYILPADLKQMQPDGQQQSSGANQPPPSAKKTLVSGVFYSPITKEAYIDIYTPITTTDYVQVGILRTTFDIHYIWDLVNKEQGTNGSGSYAFILDQNGVIIAHSSPNPDPFSGVHSQHLFQAVMPLSEKTRSLIGAGDLYGKGAENAVDVLDIPELEQLYKQVNPPVTLQFTPPGQKEVHQAARQTTYTVPWTYVVVTPLKTATAVADEQLLSTIIIACILTISATIIGVLLAQRVTFPILASVNNLRKSSESLKQLAEKEQKAATQQSWVIDSCNVGLQSLQYYTDAANTAIKQASEVGTRLEQHWENLDGVTTRKALQQLMNATRYAEKAIRLQTENNKKLTSAVKVSTQVADQLVMGATSATDAADQLEQVVNQLRTVVGK
ncbi:cache domain-containing protein [Thermosporothrix hazakensis]|jgi:hypothetical protein|uniref:Cache domain-containing protein n=2 Tax=Thermosporothrix TaxID=768650 RepID=A0A326UEM7_THEHA|nr:cache domain-containing protein [Thermosporothrix hazakensis]PZW36746.1 cache domain-containing protein [Thermosporothrix hazakensis]BBH89214.1 hypothetical protein KTC_39650 [Thermosporothrix sp. COM3]GCE47396.1 hypothetical protein KTH_22650 [Thermosporothrix hazakensis]